jgi:hypothetical protein
MSSEQILLVLVFLLPLVQYLLGAARQREGHKTEHREGQPSSAHRPPTWEPESPPHAPRPPEPTVHQVAAIPPESVSDAIAVRERTPTGDAARPPAPVPPGRPTARRRAAVTDLRNAIHVRRAIVLMTVLGPCRATNPHEWPERGGSR